MYFKAVLFFTSALLIKAISSQCGCNPGITLGQPCATVFSPGPCASLTISPCTLASAPHIPAGMSIESDNLLIAGPVVVNGRLPFSGAVALEGALPAYGTGSVAYGCGDGFAVREAPLGYVGGNCGCGGF